MTFAKIVFAMGMGVQPTPDTAPPSKAESAEPNTAHRKPKASNKSSKTATKDKAPASEGMNQDSPPAEAKRGPSKKGVNNPASSSAGDDQDQGASLKASDSEPTIAGSEMDSEGQNFAASKSSEGEAEASKPSGGQKKVPELIRSGTRRHVLELGIGPYGYGFGAELSYLYHLKGGPVGPAVGGIVSGLSHSGGSSFSIGGKFQWDFQILKPKDLGLYVGPFGGLSYQHKNFLRFDVGGHARLLLNDRWCVFVQPVVISVYTYVGSGPVDSRSSVRYRGSFGGGVTF